jgi:hypothetical protein
MIESQQVDHCAEHDDSAASLAPSETSAFTRPEPGHALAGVTLRLIAEPQSLAGDMSS